MYNDLVCGGKNKRVRVKGPIMNIVSSCSLGIRIINVDVVCVYIGLHLFCSKASMVLFLLCFSAMFA